jgi:hypothetical protein
VRELAPRRTTGSIATARTIRVPQDTWLVPALRLPRAGAATVRIKLQGQWVRVGRVTVPATGIAVVGPLRFDRPGRYPLSLTTPDGSRRYVVLDVR